MAVRGYWWWERRRGVALDVGLALVSALECALEGVEFAGDTGLPVPVGVLFGLLAGSVLVVRRRWPIAVVLVSHNLVDVFEVADRITVLRLRRDLAARRPPRWAS